MDRLSELPSQIIIRIAYSTQSTADISRIARCSRKLSDILIDALFLYDASSKSRPSKALAWALCRSGVDDDVRLRTVIKAVGSGASVNAPIKTTKKNADDNSYYTYVTPIFLATRSGRTSLLKALLAAGADVNLELSPGSSVLAAAITHRRMAALELLLSHPKARPRQVPGSGSPHLVAAVVHANMAAAKRLLPLVNPNQRNNDGFTALYLAVLEQDFSMVSLLLSDERQRPDTVIRWHNPRALRANWRPEAVTAFVLACTLPDTNIVRLLHDDSRVDVDFGAVNIAALAAASHFQLANVQVLFESKKSQTSRITLFRFYCGKFDFQSAERLVRLAGDADQEDAHCWLRVAQLANDRDLLNLIKEKWNLVDGD